MRTAPKTSLDIGGSPLDLNQNSGRIYIEKTRKEIVKLFRRPLADSLYVNRKFSDNSDEALEMVKTTS